MKAQYSYKRTTTPGGAEMLFETWTLSIQTESAEKSIRVRSVDGKINHADIDFIDNLSRCWHDDSTIKTITVETFLQKYEEALEQARSQILKEEKSERL